MTKKIDNKDYVEIEGIRCEVKNKNRKAIVQLYQNNLYEAIDNYISKIDRWNDNNKHYCESLKINLKIAPFVLGWLNKPINEDEYRIIKGQMTIETVKTKKCFKKNK